MGVRISLREFARRDGCDDKLVRRGIAEGRLPRSDDGKIDADLVGTPWRRTNQLRADKPADVPPEATSKSAGVRKRGTGADVRTIESPAEAALRAMGIPISTVSLAKKEHYLALQRQLEYDKAVGEVVHVSQVAEVVGTQLAAVRTRLLAIPAESAPRIARLSTAAEVQDALQALIVEALEQLTLDVGA